MSIPPDPADTRRAFLCKALGAGTAVVAAAALVPPLVVFVSPVIDPPDGSKGTHAVHGGADAWLDLGSIDRFAVAGPPTRVVLRRDARDAWLAKPNAPLGTIYVQRPQAADFLVLSAVCTHLGCTVAVRDTAFFCPCHGAAFNPDGSLVPGADRPNPAPRALDALAWRIPEGSSRLEVQWQRFQLNTPDKRALGAAEAG